MSFCFNFRKHRFKMETFNRIDDFIQVLHGDIVEVIVGTESTPLKVHRSILDRIPSCLEELELKESGNNNPLHIPGNISSFVIILKFLYRFYNTPPDVKVLPLSFANQDAKLRAALDKLDAYCMAHTLGLMSIKPFLTRCLTACEPFSAAIFFIIAEQMYKKHEETEGPLQQYIRNYMNLHITRLAAHMGCVGVFPGVGGNGRWSEETKARGD
ncbi:hypothetical protein M501DRAFT_992352 [Patellaria atrata CBS 101060]|uniref:BTB domain-containing protein n=1 Tax=Patellaria atrata CBS 101060 TaxID=1346257 RepID=A0A9P4VRH1_9PEZI|nr:hypothetical protein M501DRAFT_992352 [Patellaria atrata CBS 101060]